MNDHLKRTREEANLESGLQLQEQQLKRFEGKKMISWTEDVKSKWIAQQTSTSVFGDSNIFICKQVLDSIYESNVGETNIWNVDLMCQKWQLRSKEIGMIICFSDPSIYFCNQDDFEDWGIEYQSVVLTSSIPSEEEIIRVMKIIHSFKQEQPDMLIGLMSFPDTAIPTFLLIHYFLRVKRMSMEAVNDAFHLVEHLPDELKITLPSANSKWLRAFHAFTRRPALLPMRIEKTVTTIEKQDWLCSWIPRGQRVFLYLLNGKGVLISATSQGNKFVDVLPFTFLNAKGQPHTNTVCDGIVVTESKLSKPIQRVLLSDVLYINGLSLRSLPYPQRVQALHKEVVERLKETKEKDLPAIQKSPYQSIGMRDFWPLKEIRKIATTFIPSLTHETEGIVLLDPKAPYVYGDQPSPMWMFEGDVESVKLN